MMWGEKERKKEKVKGRWFHRLIGGDRKGGLGTRRRLPKSRTMVARMARTSEEMKNPRLRA